MRETNWMKKIVLLLSACCFFLCYPSAYAAKQNIGQMVWVKGTVQAMAPNNSARSLTRRAPIYTEDTIMTGDTGSGEIIFTDGSIVTLRNRTIFKVEEYKFSPAAPEDGQYTASLAKGGFRTITGLIAKDHTDHYEVRTPVATIGVRGTDYAVYYDGHTLYVKLVEGAVSVANRAGEIELDKDKNLAYAAISGLNIRPVITERPADSFKSQPGITIPPGPPPSGGDSGGGGGGASVTFQPTSTTPSGGGGSTSVSEFCIN